MKLGRNEQCYCGSAKKYKKCCLLKTENETTLDSDDFTPVQFFGYNHELTEFSKDEQLLCMVSSVTNINQLSLKEMSGGAFKVGDWFVSTGSCENIAIKGPFKSMDAAMDFGRVNYGVVSFRQ